MYAPASRGAPLTRTAPGRAGTVVGRIGLLIDRAGGVRALARRAGISEGAVRKWRKGTATPRHTYLVKLAQATGVSVQWLITGGEDAESLRNGWGDRSLMVYWQRTSAGQIQPVRISPQAFFGEIGQPAEETMIWRLERAIHHPDARRGDLALIDRRQTACLADGWYLLQDDGEPWLGRVERGPGGLSLLVPGGDRRTLETVRAQVLGRLTYVLSAV